MWLIAGVTSVAVLSGSILFCFVHVAALHQLMSVGSYKYVWLASCQVLVPAFYGQMILCLQLQLLFNISPQSTVYVLHSLLVILFEMLLALQHTLHTFTLLIYFYICWSFVFQQVLGKPAGPCVLRTLLCPCGLSRSQLWRRLCRICLGPPQRMWWMTGHLFTTHILTSAKTAQRAGWSPLVHN